MPEIDGAAHAPDGVARTEPDRDESFATKFPRIAEVRESVRANILRLATQAFGKSEVKIGDFEGLGEEGVTLDQVRSQIVELVDAQDSQRLSIPDAIAIARGISDAAQILPQAPELEEKQRLSEEKHAEVRKLREKLESKKGRLGLSAIGRKKMEQEVTEQEEESRRLTADFYKASGERYEDGQERLRLRSRQEGRIEKNFAEAVGSEIISLTSAYQDVLSQIYEDGTLVREVGESYLDAVKERIEELVTDGAVTEDERDGLYEVFSKIYDEKITDSYARDRLLMTVLSPEFDRVYPYLQRIEMGDDFRAVNEIVSAMYVEDVLSIAIELNHVAPRKVGGDWTTTLLHMQDLPRDTNVKRAGQSDIQSAYSQLYRPKLKLEDKMTVTGDVEHDILDLLYECPGAMRVFGDQIEKIRNKNLEVILNNSLYDSRAIEALSWYPEPDAIRNIVILASAYDERNRTIRVNNTLETLSQRSDWAAILDRAVAKYPELSDARSVLEHWENPGRKVKNTALRDAAASFTYSILLAEQQKGELGNRRLVELATHALPTEKLLDLSVKQGLLQEDECVVFKEAYAIMSALEPEPDSREAEDKATQNYFRKGFREAVTNLLYPDQRITQSVILPRLDRLRIITQKIVDSRDDSLALKYLNMKDVFTAPRSVVTDDRLSIFLDAYKTCPALASDESLLSKFRGYFKGQETVDLYRDVYEAYRHYASFSLMERMFDAVHSGRLTKERVLELSEKGLYVLDLPTTNAIFTFATNFPDVFLRTDEGIKLVEQLIEKGIGGIDEDCNKKVGREILTMPQTRSFGFGDLMMRVVNKEISRVNSLSADAELEINEDNWQPYLMAYIKSHNEIFNIVDVSSDLIPKLDILFADSSTRDFCLIQLQKSWTDYLKDGVSEDLPFSLSIITDFIDFAGAGPFSHIGSLSKFIRDYRLMFNGKLTSERTKNEVFQGISEMEARFRDQKWSNEDRSEFYNISKDILNAAPSIYADFLSVFRDFTPVELRRFSKELFPMYRAKLAMVALTNEEEEVYYERSDLVALRRDIRLFHEILRTESTPFEMQKNKLVVELTDAFKDKFGIIKIPEEFGPDQLRSLTNVSLYLANMEDRTPEKELILGFHLALMLNSKWDDFRRGEEVDPEDYLDSEKASEIQHYLEERRELSPLKAENLGLTEEELPEFMRILGQENQNILIGDVETIDVKLTNVILNLKGLEDPDLYPDQLDRERLGLLLKHGNKAVGAAVAKLYQGLINPARRIKADETVLRIQQEIQEIFERREVELTPESLKADFQDGIKPLATVVNVLNTIEDTQAEAEIENLRELLKPPTDVVAIFNRLGEDFTETSGALALSQDLDHLDTLVVKRADELESGEIEILHQYIERIRTKVIELQKVYDQIREKFVSVKQGTGSSTNELLQVKLADIDRIINAQVTQQTITSVATGNMNDIIENMRECLACTVQGSNNDTNLTFGDPNKFYLYSQSEGRARGSISDQIVFLEPITFGDEQEIEMAFVFDRLYGMSTPSVLESQIMTVMQKYKALKKDFPAANLSLFVTGAAIKTGGMSADMLSEWLNHNMQGVSVDQTQGKVDVVESASGDHYVEFGGNARKSGSREVSGIRIKLAA